MSEIDYTVLCEGIEGNILRDEPMSRHTMYKIGGPADLFIAPADRGSLAAILRRCTDGSIPVYVVGGGANLLVHDEGIRGVVVHLGGLKRAEWRDDDGQLSLHVEAGAVLAPLVAEAERRGWSGLESLAGIPGSVGGALVMNAGTKAGSISDVVREIEIMSLDGRETRTISRDEAGYGYRRSSLSDVAVIAAVLDMKKGVPEEVKAATNVVRGYRKGQPVGVPCAGSVFKNPPGDFAGRLIEAAGLKGQRLGG
ncbi:MAG: UDP-N-acetylmuramate dehydrogenase, partial [Nitrospirota bacterium]|nr:UDP-N-acetylmuramate dehydrogenase [Nitrospirota bacterium]